MVQTMAICALCFLQTSAFIHHNGSMPLLRTFAAHYVRNPDEPIEPPLDELEGTSGDAEPCSGMGPPPVENHAPRHPAKKHYQVSTEAQHSLQGNISTVLVPTVYTAVFLISVPLNLAAVLLFLRRKRPRKPAVIFMLNLAFADLLFALVLPLKIFYHYHGNHWVFGSVLCRLVTAAFYGNMYCSVLLVTCISIDRFWAVVYPMHALTWRSPRTASASCAATWLLALGGVAPLLCSEQIMHLPDLGITACHEVQDAERLRFFSRHVFPLYACLFFVLPLCVTSACYVRIVLALAAAKVHSRARRNRAGAMAVAVLVVFAACFAPSNVVMVIHSAQLARNAAADASYEVYLISTCVGTLSCCLDPLIYYFGSSRCQRQALALLTCRGLAGAEASRSGSTKHTQSTRSTEMESLQDATLRDRYWEKRTPCGDGLGAGRIKR